MFDYYSQSNAHTRSVVYLHAKGSPTWPEMLRECRDDNVESPSHKAYSKSAFSLLVAGLSALFHRRQELVQPPAKQIQVHGHS